MKVRGQATAGSCRIIFLCDPVVVALDDPDNKGIQIEEYVWGQGGGTLGLYRKIWSFATDTDDVNALPQGGWTLVPKIDLTTPPNTDEPPQIRVLSGITKKTPDGFRPPTPIRRLVYTPLQGQKPIDQKFGG
jgi:hypothetical protein